MRIKAKVVGAESREYGTGNGFGDEKHYELLRLLNS